MTYWEWFGEILGEVLEEIERSVENTLGHVLGTNRRVRSAGCAYLTTQGLVRICYCFLYTLELSLFLLF